MTRTVRVSLEEDFLNDCTADLARKVAERAYYKAEKRGFAAGHETEGDYHQFKALGLGLLHYACYGHFAPLKDRSV